RDGLDELSTGAVNDVLGVGDGQVRATEIDPADFGFAPPADAHIAGGDPGDNARITRAVLDGVPGPARDLVVLNAGAAVWVAGGADDLAGGIARAQESIDEGAAAERLAAFVATTQRLAGA
ncbi:MAG: hypothetical protein RLN63_07980, partial [Miltoncostaeaceae bacterium]